MRAWLKLSLLFAAFVGVVGVSLHEYARKRAGKILAIEGEWYEVETQDPSLDDPDLYCADEGADPAVCVGIFNEHLFNQLGISSRKGKKR
jgi:hypothetical protein